jgi:hypothetical protein
VLHNYKSAIDADILIVTHRSHFCNLSQRNANIRGDVETILLALFMECSASDCRLILLDDIDFLAPEVGSYSPITNFYTSNALIHGIDAIVQRHNRDNIDRRILIVATCSDRKKVLKSLLVPHRLGDIRKVIRLPYPLRQHRLTLIYNMLLCERINMIWDLHKDGYGDHVYSTELRNLSAEGNNMQTTEKATLDSNRRSITYLSNAFNLAVTLSHGTQVRVHAYWLFIQSL